MHPSTYLVEVAPLSCRRGLFTKPTPRTPPSYSISLSPQVPSQVSHQQSRSSQSRHLQVVKEISLDLELYKLRMILRFFSFTFNLNCKLYVQPLFSQMLLRDPKSCYERYRNIWKKVRWTEIRIDNDR